MNPDTHLLYEYMKRVGVDQSQSYTLDHNEAPLAVLVNGLVEHVNKTASATPPTKITASRIMRSHRMALS